MLMAMARTRVGYEHGYRFSTDDEIISQYPSHKNVFLFEIRTNFILKKTRTSGDADEMMMTMGLGSERYGPTKIAGSIAKRYLNLVLSYRLKDYWMSDDEIDMLVSGAVDFAQQIAGRVIGDDGVFSFPIPIPVVVDVEVCTVQQEGEPLDAAVDRAIRPECLVPLYIFPMYKGEPDVERRLNSIDPSLGSFLMQLPKIRAAADDVVADDDIADHACMELCSVCSRNPTIASQISVIPACRHAFHSHCLVQWLLSSKSCPLCHQQAHHYLIHYNPNPNNVPTSRKMRFRLFHK